MKRISVFAICVLTMTLNAGCGVEKATLFVDNDSNDGIHVEKSKAIGLYTLAQVITPSDNWHLVNTKWRLRKKVKSYSKTQRCSSPTLTGRYGDTTYWTPRQIRDTQSVNSIITKTGKKPGPEWNLANSDRCQKSTGSMCPKALPHWNPCRLSSSADEKTSAMCVVRDK
jgi:hypothetical protein